MNYSVQSTLEVCLIQLKLQCQCYAEFFLHSYDHIDLGFSFDGVLVFYSMCGILKIHKTLKKKKKKKGVGQNCPIMV